MKEVFAIQSHEVDGLWDQLRPHLERFEQETGRTDAETMRQQAKDKERQIWGVRDGARILSAVVTEIYQTARGNVCWIWAMGGTENTPAEMQILYRVIENWAHALDCKSIGIQGRKGWLKVLPGFEVTAYVMEKEICPCTKA